MAIFRNRRERMLGEELRRVIREEASHFESPADHRAEIESRVRDRLARRYGEDTPTWMLILELLIRLLPLLLQNPKEEFHTESDVAEAATDVGDESAIESGE